MYRNNVLAARVDLLHVSGVAVKISDASVSKSTATLLTLSYLRRVEVLHN